MPVARTASWIAILQLAACVPDENPAFLSDQLKPEGGCWEVDLTDGLDEANTNELHDLYACLNRSGNFNSFKRLFQTMDEKNRFDEPIGLPLVRMGNELMVSQTDMLGVVGDTIERLANQQEDVLLGMELLVELAHGQPFAEIQSEYPNHGPVSEGLMVPAINVAKRLARDALDGGASTRESFIAMTDSDLYGRVNCFSEHMWAAQDPVLNPIGERFFVSVAEAWQEASDSSNDRMTFGPTNSLKRLLETFIAFEESIHFLEFRDAAHAILSDERVRANTKTEMLAAHRSGHLEPLVKQLNYLGNVDVHARNLGDPLAEDDSALQVGVRLLHRTNRPLDCDLLFFDVRIENMAVRMLQELSELSTGQVENGLDFFTMALGGTLTPAILETAAATGVCDGFSQPLLDDLRVLDRLADPEVGNFVEVMHALLDIAYQEGGVDRLPELVDAISQMYLHGMMPPIEEVLRDLHSSQAVRDAVALVPRLIEEDYVSDFSCSNGASPLGFDHIWSALQHLVSPGTANTDEAFQVLVAQTEHEDFWKALDRFAALAAHPTSRIHQLPDLLTRTANTEVETSAEGPVHRLLHDESAWNTVLATAESDQVVDAVCIATETEESPLDFVSRLILSDTVTVMLQTIDVVLDTLTAE